MLFKIKKEKQINSLRDIREKKQLLELKANAKALKIKSKLNKLVINTSPQLVFDEVLEKFELQNSLLNLAPILLKYRHQLAGLNFFSKIRNSPRRKFIIIAIGAVLAGVTAYFYLNRKKQTSEND
jgi:hypothetical protein